MATHIFYHSADLDGHCGGAVCSKALPGSILHPIDHGDDFPHNDILTRDTVVLVDWTPPAQDFIRLAGKLDWHPERIIWLDHHEPNIQEIVKTVQSKGKDATVFQGNALHFDDGLSGCEKAWVHFFPGKPMPYTVRMLGRYDVWDHEDPEVLPFQYGMKAEEETDPHKNPWLWKGLLIYCGELEPKILRAGNAISKYVQAQNHKLARACALDIRWKDQDWLAINAPLSNSKVVDGLWKDNHVGVLVFAFHGSRNKWKVTLFRNPLRDDISMAAIAKSMGGGGHDGAAGFWCDALPDWTVAEAISVTRDGR